MRKARRQAVEQALKAQTWGLVLGTLGRQGNPRIMETLKQRMDSQGVSYVSILLSEVTPPKLAMLSHIDAFVQIACPRLSIDWGEGFQKPTLNPYEALVALGIVDPWWQDREAEDEVALQPYPMDYYAKDGGSWNSSYHKRA